MKSPACKADLGRSISEGDSSFGDIVPLDPFDEGRWSTAGSNGNVKEGPLNSAIFASF